MGLLTLLVHNDAIKTDPKEIYGWRVYAVACAVSHCRKAESTLRLMRDRHASALCCLVSKPVSLVVS